MDIEFVKTAFLTMFVALDPPGLAPVFVALTVGMSAVERKSVALRGVVIAFCVLAASALFGKGLLEALGVGIPAFRIAGGLLLFSIAIEMIFERRAERKTETAEKAITLDHIKNIAAFPLAIPLISGPGAITAVIVQASNAKGEPLNLLALVGILFVILLSCYIVFLAAQKIDKFLGVTGRVVLTRLLGILLAAIAVQVIGDSIFAFIKSHA